jgi:uncharacterized membrane protein/plastocyanin
MHYVISSLILIMFTATSVLVNSAYAQSALGEICEEEVCHVQITKDGFVPKRLLIQLGVTVIWTNLDNSRHTVTSGSPTTITAPLKSMLLEKGQTYEFTFDYSGLYQGAYKYFDQVTEIMRAEIVIQPQAAQKEEPQQMQAIRIDFTDQEAGIKSISLGDGNITSVEMDQSSNRLILNLAGVKVVNVLKITLERKLLDSTSDGKDTSFKILVDGKEGFYEEISSAPTERSLQVVVPSRTARIEIAGTSSSASFLRFTESISAIYDAEQAITTYKNQSIAVGEAEVRLLEAKNSFDMGKYADAEMLAIEADMIYETASHANTVIAEVQRSIGESSEKGYDVSSALVLFTQAIDKYDKGNYAEALSLAEQARTIAANAVQANNAGSEQPSAGNNEQTSIGDGELLATAPRSEYMYLIAGLAAASAAGVGVTAYVRSRKSAVQSVVSPEPVRNEADIKIDVERIFAERPHLRYDDRDVVRYIAEKGGEALESEIREKFNLAKTTAWRQVKRLEGEGIVEIEKIGIQNLIRIRKEFGV